MGRRFFFARYRPGLVGHLKSPEDWRERIDALSSFAEPPEVEAIVIHRPTGAPIGAMFLAGIDRLNGKAEFSAGFLRGRGTRAIWEAIHFALHHAFDTLGLRKLVFYVLADNREALRLLERVRARPEGVFRDELASASGGYVDLHRFALFRSDDWPEISAELGRLIPLQHSHDDRG